MTIILSLIPLVALFVMIHFFGLKCVVIIYGILVIVAILGRGIVPLTFYQFTYEVLKTFESKTKDLHFFIKGGVFYCSLPELNATITYCPKYREWYCNQLRYNGLASISEDLN